MEQEQRLDSIFHALADRTRRDILGRLAKESLIISSLAERYEMSLVAVSKHIKVLERAGLVETTKTGRVNRCVMNGEPLDLVTKQIEFFRQYWERQLDGLDEYIKDMKNKKGPGNA